VFEVARQMLGDRFGRRPTLGEDDVELFTKHGLGELADALLRHRVPPLRPGGLLHAVIALYRREHGETAGGDQGSRPRPDPFGGPVFSCKQQEKNRRPGTTGACGLPISSRMTTGNERDRRPAPRPGWLSITGPSRTKTGNRRNPGLQDEDA